MRALTLSSMLLLTACATGDLGLATTGAQEAVQYERLGTLTTQDVSEIGACNAEQVSWCTGSRLRKSCKCLSIREVESRAQRAIDALDFPKN